jgi:hypothetical protein
MEFINLLTQFDDCHLPLAYSKPSRVQLELSDVRELATHTCGTSRLMGLIRWDGIPGGII